MIAMQMRGRFGLLLAFAPLLPACGPGEDCHRIFEYAINADVHGAENQACEVELGAGSKVARYEFVQPCSLSWQDGTVIGDSPAPDSFSSGDCLIFMGFTGDAAHQLATFVGTESIPMIVSCGGSVVKTETLKPATKSCAG